MAGRGAYPLVSMICGLLFIVLVVGAAGAVTPPPEAASAEPRRPGTLFGAALQPHSGESYYEARKRVDRRFGRLETIRYFHPGPPSSWANIQHNVGRRPAVVSFKIHPEQIVSGSYDRQLRTWFQQAPRHRATWWSYMPEPEGDIEAGHYTAGRYRQAWVHLTRLADAAHNRKLRSTLILMNWTLNPLADRRFRDYYPGRGRIDVLAWDGYNHAERTGTYAPPREIFGQTIRRTRLLGDAFAVAETGSVLTGPNPRRHRAAWLRRLGGYLERHHAVFATYFNVRTGSDYRLRDEVSRRSWRRMINR